MCRRETLFRVIYFFLKKSFLYIPPPSCKNISLCVVVVTVFRQIGFPVKKQITKWNIFQNQEFRLSDCNPNSILPRAGIAVPQNWRRLNEKEIKIKKLSRIITIFLQKLFLIESHIDFFRERSLVCIFTVIKNIFASLAPVVYS